MGYAEHFSISNIPFGIASDASHSSKAVATRLGDLVFFLSDLDLDYGEEILSALSQVSSLSVTG
jgi:fumarylacetoacetase